MAFFNSFAGMDGVRGFLIKADKSCTKVDTHAGLESATAADTKLLWIDLQGELAVEAGESLDGFRQASTNTTATSSFITSI